MTDDRYSIETREKVFEAICALGQELTTPPTQKQIADYANVSQQTVSNVFRELVMLERIVWLTRYTYRVPGADWNPPDES